MDHKVSTFTTSDAVNLQFEHCQQPANRHSAIIFVHGIGGNKEQFNHQQSFANQYCVILPSLRGHGASGTPRPITVESTSFSRQAQDILELADHLGLDGFHFVGHSIGALIGFELLQLAPQRLLSVSACGISPRFRVKGPALLMQLTLYRVLTALRMESLLSKLTAKNSLAQEIFTEMIRETHPQVLKYLIRHMRRADYLQTLKNNQSVPVLLMRLEGDHVINRHLDPCLNELHGQRNLDVMRIHSTGHMINLETPDYFNRILQSFLTKVSLKDARIAAEP